LIILTMPDDDITHPIPDLTVILPKVNWSSTATSTAREFTPDGCSPLAFPSDEFGYRPEKTREDHRAVADQLYALYAEGEICAAWSPLSVKPRFQQMTGASWTLPGISKCNSSARK